MTISDEPPKIRFNFVQGKNAFEMLENLIGQKHLGCELKAIREDQR